MDDPRDFADECVRLALEIGSVPERQRLLGMAETWLEVAASRRGAVDFEAILDREWLMACKRAEGSY
jgi:hypothetical protein